MPVLFFLFFILVLISVFTVSPDLRPVSKKVGLALKVGCCGGRSGLVAEAAEHMDKALGFHFLALQKGKKQNKTGILQ
jgi:hypothetical protein